MQIQLEPKWRRMCDVFPILLLHGLLGYSLSSSGADHLRPKPDYPKLLAVDLTRNIIGEPSSEPLTGRTRATLTVRNLRTTRGAEEQGRNSKLCGSQLNP